MFYTFPRVAPKYTIVIISMRRHCADCITLHCHSHLASNFHHFITHPIPQSCIPICNQCYHKYYHKYYTRVYCPKIASYCITMSLSPSRVVPIHISYYANHHAMTLCRLPHPTMPFTLFWQAVITIFRTKFHRVVFSFTTNTIMRTERMLTSKDCKPLQHYMSL